MGDGRSDIVAYLPASLLRAVADQPAVSLPWHLEIEGTMVMADLSGFTALSERLARLGDEGAERLTDTINSFFERMLKTASRFGGDTLTFGGDAILLLFDGPEHATRAAVAALEMLKQVDRAAAVEAGDGKVKIGMSVGAHSDTFVLAAVGLADERAHLVVLGRGAELTALAEAQAERGQFAVSSTCRDLLPGDFTLAPIGDYWRVDEVGACALPRLVFEPPPVSDEELRQVTPFLPAYARAAIGSGDETIQLTPEHRRTVIVFVNILGLNEVMEAPGVDAAIEQLQAYSAMLTRLAARHQGFVVSSDIATKGTKLVVTFGAPVAHEYAPANAARFALDLNAELRDSGLDVSHKIGVNAGHVFAGEVGPPFRRQYTVMGDAVNLAARLMAAAQPGQTLVSRNLLNYVSHDLCARELPPTEVKGKEKPVAVCVLEQEEPDGAHVHGGLQPGRWQGRLFGRRKELGLLARAWERACRGKGRTILVEGEAGVGKTRLLDEALRAMSATGRVTRAACFEHLQAAPLTPWVEILHAILGVSRGGPASARTGRVDAFLDEHVPELVEFAPLLNPVLGLSLPQNEVVGSLDAQARRQKLFDVVARIIVEAAGDRGHAIVIEDVHWMDESSYALAGRLAGLISGNRVLLLLTTRPTDVRGDFKRAATRRLVLDELSEPESLAMVREALGVTNLPAEIGEAVYAKTRGNPLFLEEVVHSLQAPGVLDRILSASTVTRAAELASLEIPDRVQGLLMSRIDRLSPDTREVLKAGSVVGRSFDESVLAGIDYELLRSVSLGKAFDELIAAALIVPERDGDSLDVSFRHALVQDVAYESLPFARRRDLHGRLAHYLETTQPVPDHGLLVHHYRHAGDTEKTRMHAVRAAESSVAVYANLEAIDYLAVALDTATSRTPRDACLRSRFEELMGDSLETLARYDEAVDCFSRARRRWASPAVRKIAASALRDLSPIDEADARDSLLCWKIAVAMERGCGAYTRALRWLEKGAATLPPSHLRLTARLEITRGGFLTRLGRFREAVEFGEQGLALAREDADPGLQAYALTLLGFAFDSLGRYERGVECHTEAIVLYEEAGDLHGLAMSHGNLAGSHMYLGEFRAALEHDELALALHARVGSTGWVAIEHVNLGAVLIQMGDLEAALEHLDQALRLRSCQGVNPGLIGFALVLCCQAHVCAGDLEAASREIAEGRQLLEDIGAHGQLLDAGVAEAELQLARGDLVQAAESGRLTLTQAQAAGAELNQVQALCMLGRVRLAEGDPQAAIAGLEAGAALAEKIGAGYERARTLAVLAEARAACADGSRACEDALAQAIHLFRKMGARYDLEKALEVRERLALHLQAEGAAGGARR